MKPRHIFLWIVPAVLAVLIGWRLWGYWQSASALEPAPPARSAAPAPEAAARAKEARAVAAYVAGQAEAGLLPDASDPAARDDIAQWERRIIAYARERHAKTAAPAQVHALAQKTAGLVRLLQEAQRRQIEGAPPYTAESSFDTMTLVMHVEEEFQEALGLAFADFLDALDVDVLKAP